LVSFALAQTCPCLIHSHIDADLERIKTAGVNSQSSLCFHMRMLQMNSRSRQTISGQKLSHDDREKLAMLDACVSAQ
jgi:hypothetical protein